jgi:hypothetical protein
MAESSLSFELGLSRLLATKMYIRHGKRIAECSTRQPRD